MNLSPSELELAWKRVKIDQDRVFIRHPYEIVLIEQDAKAWLDRLGASLAKGTYGPQPLVLCDVPKTPITVRPGGHLTALDRTVFAACVGRCLPEIGKTLTWSNGTPDFSYQLSSDLTKPNWLKSRFECWRSFRDESLRSLPPDVTHVVVADVAGFYENIDIPTLISDLKSTGADSGAIDQLSACLNRWAHIHSRSIPQGHSAADILAKLYLHPVDVTLRDLGYRHLRFVDDFRIFCRTRVEAMRALTELTRQLRLRGLVLNSAKSQILVANQARRKFDGTIPIIEGVRQSFVKNITELMGAEYVTSAEAQSVLGKSTEEIPISIIESTFEAYFLEGRDNVFRATLFHFLIHRLGAARSQYTHLGIVWNCWDGILKTLKTFSDMSKR